MREFHPGCQDARIKHQTRGVRVDQSVTCLHFLVAHTFYWSTFKPKKSLIRNVTQAAAN